MSKKFKQIFMKNYSLLITIIPFSNNLSIAKTQNVLFAETSIIRTLIFAVIVTTAFFVIRNFLRLKKRKNIINDINERMSIEEIIKKYDIDEFQASYKFDFIASTNEIAEKLEQSFGKANPRFNNEDSNSIKIEQSSLGLIADENKSHYKYSIEKIHFEENNFLIVASYNTRTNSVYSDMTETVNVIIVANIDKSIRKRIGFYSLPIENTLKYRNIMKEFSSSIVVFMQNNNLIK